MNKTNIALILLAITLYGCPIIDYSYKVRGTVFYINESADTVVSLDSHGGCEEKVIPPNDTLIYEFSSSVASRKKLNINIDNFPTDVFTCREMLYKDGSTLRVEEEIKDIKNYENRKETSPRVFEFTFRFTEEKKAKGGPYGYAYKLRGKVFYINESADTVVTFDSYAGCKGKVIPPNDTLVYVASRDFYSLEELNINIDTFPIHGFTCRAMQYKNGRTLRCDFEIKDIKNYENRKEISPGFFEFTFRFTEEKKAKAFICSTLLLKGTFARFV